MPKIINAYEAGNGGIADALKSMGESIWGNEARNEGLRQNALKLKRENDSAVPFANAAASNNPEFLRYYGALSGKHGNDVANWNLLSASDRAGANLDDPRLGVAQMGAGHPATATMEDQNRQRANARAMEQDRTDASRYTPLLTDDPLTGGKKPLGAMNQRTGQFVDTGGQPLQQPQGFNRSQQGGRSDMGGPMNVATTDLTEPIDDPRQLTGQDALQYWMKTSPDLTRRALAVLDGLEAPPKAGMRVNNVGNQILNVARQLEPGFDSTKWTERYRTAQSFSGNGPDAVAVKAANQAITHAAELAGAGVGLHNYSNIGEGIPVVGGLIGLGTTAANSVKNKAVGASGSAGPGYTSPFDMARNAFADEIAKVFRASGVLPEHEVQRWYDTINSSQSEPQLRANMGQAMRLYQGAVQKLEEKRTAGMGTFRQQPPLLAQTTKDTMGRIDRWVHGGKWEEPAAKIQGQHAAGAPQPVVTTQSQAGPGPTGQFNDRFGGAPAPQSGGPAPGAVEGGYRFLGGNPGDPKSWARVQ